MVHTPSFQEESTSRNRYNSCGSSSPTRFDILNINEFYFKSPHTSFSILPTFYFWHSFDSYPEEHFNAFLKKNCQNMFIDVSELHKIHGHQTLKMWNVWPGQLPGRNIVGCSSSRYEYVRVLKQSFQLFIGSSSGSRRTLLQFWSFKIRHSTLLSYIRFADLLILRLLNCGRVRRAGTTTTFNSI